MTQNKTLELNDFDYDMLRQCVIAQIENIVGNMNPKHAQIELRKLEPLINKFGIVDKDVSEFYPFSTVLAKGEW